MMREKEDNLDVIQIVGFRNLGFRGSDGTPISGMKIYFTFEPENDDVRGLCADSAFVKDCYIDRSDDISLGERYEVIYNKHGKISRLIMLESK